MLFCNHHVVSKYLTVLQGQWQSCPWRGKDALPKHQESAVSIIEDEIAFVFRSTFWASLAWCRRDTQHWQLALGCFVGHPFTFVEVIFILLTIGATDPANPRVVYGESEGLAEVSSFFASFTSASGFFPRIASSSASASSFFSLSLASGSISPPSVPKITIE